LVDRVWFWVKQDLLKQKGEMGAQPTKKGRKESHFLLIDWEFDPDIRKWDVSLFSMSAPIREDR
jgi:hypothetical protein